MFDLNPTLQFFYRMGVPYTIRSLERDRSLFIFFFDFEAKFLRQFSQNSLVSFIMTDYLEQTSCRLTHLRSVDAPTVTGECRSSSNHLSMSRSDDISGGRTPWKICGGVVVYLVLSGTRSQWWSVPRRLDKEVHNSV
jgi:hypothetical protein